jgi:hypothetical protein
MSLCSLSVSIFVIVSIVSLPRVTKSHRHPNNLPKHIRL